MKKPFLTVCIVCIISVLTLLFVSCGEEDKGIIFEDYKSVAALELGVTVDKKSLAIVGIAAGSAAEKAGLKLGDLLKKLDSQDVATTEVVKQTVRTKALSANKQIAVIMLRGNQEMTINVTLSARQGVSKQPTPTPVPPNYDYF